MRCRTLPEVTAPLTRVSSGVNLAGARVTKAENEADRNPDDQVAAARGQGTKKGVSRLSATESPERRENARGQLEHVLCR